MPTVSRASTAARLPCSQASFKKDMFACELLRARDNIELNTIDKKDARLLTGTNKRPRKESEAQHVGLILLVMASDFWLSKEVI